jgi:hypothetical protein
MCRVRWRPKQHFVYRLAISIPPFDGTGLLPFGQRFGDYDDEIIYCGHSASLQETYDAFVGGAFSSSLTRPALYRELAMLFALASEHLNAFTLLVSGEFVVDRVEPKTIFVVLEVLGSELGNSGSLWSWLLHRIYDAGTMEIGDDDTLTINTALTQLYPPGHPRYEVGLKQQNLNRRDLGEPIPVIQAGYVEIDIVPEGRFEDDLEKLEGAPMGGQDSPGD